MAAAASLIWFLLFALLIIPTPLKTTAAAAQQVSAMYIFGDSLVDVGNNNYIELSYIKADFPHNGIDFVGGKATGRFSNGKNSADFIAEKIGLATAPPYLSNTSDVFLKGVSFASGGSGLFNTTGQGFLRKCIPLTKQVDYYSTVHDRVVQVLGAEGAQNHLSKSIFAIVIGSNDLFSYFNTDNKVKKVSSDEYINQLMTILQGLLQRLHSLGARKLVVTGVGPLGCTPARRHDNSNEECGVQVNAMVVKYNQALTTMLKELSSQVNGINYSFLDTYNALVNIINNPTKYGFVEVKAACCGFGKLNADSFCIPIATYCPNRSDHVFWDAVHPTEKTDSVLIDMFFTGSYPLITPLNLEQLIAL